MGSIEPYETASGRRYRVRYRRPDHRQGAKRGFRTKREAERYLISVESQMQTGDFIDPAGSRVTVGELAPDWLDVKRMKLKPSSASCWTTPGVSTLSLGGAPCRSAQ